MTELHYLDWTKKLEVIYPPKVIMRFVLSSNAIVCHLTIQKQTHTHSLRYSVILWRWSCRQVNADPGECYLQVLGSADIQAGDVLDPLIDPIHNRVFKRPEPGADGRERTFFY